MPGGGVGLLLSTKGCTWQERYMDGVNRLQHPQLRKADVMLELAEGTCKCLARSLQKLALYLCNTHVKLLSIVCTPQPKLPLQIHVTHSPSNADLKPKKSWVSLFHILYHQTVLALSLKYPKSDHFLTPLRAVHIILFSCLDYWSISLVLLSLIICPSPFATEQSGLLKMKLYLKILPVKLRINLNYLPNHYKTPWSDTWYSINLVLSLFTTLALSLSL